MQPVEFWTGETIQDRQKFLKLDKQIKELKITVEGYNLIRNIYGYTKFPHNLFLHSLTPNIKEKGWWDEDKKQIDEDVVAYIGAMFHFTNNDILTIKEVPLYQEAILTNGALCSVKDADELYQIFFNLAKLNPSLVRRIKRLMPIGDDYDKLKELGLMMEDENIEPVVLHFLDNIEISNGNIKVIRPRYLSKYPY